MVSRYCIFMALCFVLASCGKAPSDISSEGIASENGASEEKVSEGQVSEEAQVSEQGSVDDALALHSRILTIDTHIDIPVTLGTGDADPRIKGPMQVDIPSMKEGGLDAAFFIVYVGQGAVDDEGYAQAYRDAQKKFSAIELMLSNSPDDIVLVTNPSELKEAVANGKLAAAIGVENAYPLGPNYEHLQEFYDRGARYISLTHFGHNHFGDSSVPKGEQHGIEEPVNEGISELGLSLIDRMNAMGIMVDVSHTSKQSTLDAVEYSKVPVIASHSGVMALNEHPRNLTDEEIKAIAAKGGVIQLVAFDAYLRQVSKENMEAQKAIMGQLGLTTPDWYKTASQTTINAVRQARAALHAKFPRATVSDYVDHIDYVVKLVGVDHAGIVSDFGGGGGVHGWDYISETPVITKELLARGYSEADIAKIWSGNVLRVWQDVEDYAQGLAAAGSNVANIE